MIYRNRAFSSDKSVKTLFFVHADIGRNCRQLPVQPSLPREAARSVPGSRPRDCSWSGEDDGMWFDAELGYGSRGQSHSRWGGPFEIYHFGHDNKGLAFCLPIEGRRLRLLRILREADSTIISMSCG